MLLQPTNHHHGHHTLHTLHTNWDAATMNRILARARAQPILLREGLLVPRELAMQVPSADAPAQHGLALARHPHVVVGHDARMRRGVEQRLVRIRQRDVDHDGRRDGEESLAQGAAKAPGVGGGELRED